MPSNPKSESTKRPKQKICKTRICKIRVSASSDYCAFCESRRKPRGNKYSAEKLKQNGKTYDSKLESYVANDLLLMQKAGEIKEIKEQYSVSHYVNEVKISTNQIDFKCEMSGGEIWFVEAKGIETGKYKIDKKLHIAMLDELYPDCKYFVVKGNKSHRIWKEITLKRIVTN